MRGRAAKGKKTGCDSSALLWEADVKNKYPAYKSIEVSSAYGGRSNHVGEYLLGGTPKNCGAGEHRAKVRTPVG